MLSFIIAVFASYAALNLAAKISRSRGRTQKWWLVAGSFVMGSGVWSMHFVGMLAFHVNVPVNYDIPIRLLSMLCSIVASFIAFQVLLSKGVIGSGGRKTSKRIPAGRTEGISLRRRRISFGCGKLRPSPGRETSDRHFKYRHQTVCTEGNELYITASIGISLAPRHGTDRSSLLKASDTAMYNAKNARKNRYCVFDDEMDKRLLRRLELEKDMRGASERKEFYIVYQPKWDVQTDTPVGLEALMRWPHSNSAFSLRMNSFLLRKKRG